MEAASCGYCRNGHSSRSVRLHVLCVHFSQLPFQFSHPSKVVVTTTFILCTDPVHIFCIYNNSASCRRSCFPYYVYMRNSHIHSRLPDCLPSFTCLHMFSTLFDELFLYNIYTSLHTRAIPSKHLLFFSVFFSFVYKKKEHSFIFHVR